MESPTKKSRAGYTNGEKLKFLDLVSLHSHARRTSARVNVRVMILGPAAKRSHERV